MKRASEITAEDDERTKLRLLARATFVALISFMFAGLFAHVAYEYFCFYPVAFAAGIQYVTQQMVPNTVTLARDGSAG